MSMKTPAPGRRSGGGNSRLGVLYRLVAGSLAVALICGFAAIFGAAVPAGAATESFALTSASLPGQSSVTWQGPPVNPPGTPNVFPSTVSLSGQIDSSTGAISAASLSLPAIPITADGENTTFAFSEVHPGTATGSFNSSTGAVTLNDSLTLTFSVPAIPITCVSTPINVALAGTWDSATENVTLATTTSFTIPQFPAGSGENCGDAAPSLNASPGGTAGSVGNVFSLALSGKFAPGLPTTTALSVSPPAPQLAGTSVTLTATVTDPSGAGTPSGSVTFLDNGASIGTGALSSGTATLTTSALPGGTNQLSAAYVGDTTYAASASSTQAYAIQPLPAVSATLPSQVTLGASAAPLTLSIANPASGTDWNAMYLQIALSGLTQSAANRPTLSYQDSAGNLCPLAYTTASGTTAYYSGAGPAPCGTPPASFSLDAGSTLTVPLSISYPSSAVPGTQTLTATLYTGSCTSATSCTATTPLSGSTAPKSAGSFPVAPTARVALSSMSATVTSPGDGNVPQGFSVEAAVMLTKPTTPSGMPNPTGTVTCAIDGGSTTVTESAKVSTECSFSATPTSLVPGTHTIAVAYSGDSTYLPASTSTTFTVTSEPPGVPFSCLVESPLGNSTLATTLQVQTDPVPANVPANSSYTMTGIDITMNADDSFGISEFNGTPLTSLSAGLSDGQTITTPVEQSMNFTQNGDVDTGTILGFTAMVPTGVPGATTNDAITSLGFAFNYSGLAFTIACSQGSLPLPPVTASGTTLSVTPDSPANADAPVTLAATVYPTPTSSSGGGQVDFYDGSTDLATVVVPKSGTGAGIATFTTANLSVGDHQLTAVWSGNLLVPTNTSNTVDYAVGTATTTTVASSTNPANAANPVTYTATVSPPLGALTQPTGDVSFTADGNPISSCQNVALSMASPPTATCTTSFAAGTTHAIVATYSGDGTYIGLVSDTLTQTMLPGTNTTILSTKDPSPAGNVTFWAGVSPSAGTGATPTGTVAFTIDGSVYKPCNAQPLGPGGGASCTVSFKAGTTHKVFATYAGSSSYSGSKSSTITQTVTGAKSSTTPKATGGSATLGAGKSLTAGQSIATGSYKLVMQSDGNLVEYQGSKALWASGTSGHSGTGVVMQKDGNLVEYLHGEAIWASNTSGHAGAFLALQGSDGNVVIYGPGGNALWAAGA